MLGLGASTILREERSEVNECVLLVPLAGLGRDGVWVIHVVATVIITVIHVLILEVRNAIGRILILRLQDDAIVSMIKLKLFNSGLQSEDWSADLVLHSSVACTCGSDMEELLHVRSNDRPLLFFLRLLVAAKIVTAEHNLLCVLLFLGELRIDEEDWGLEFLARRINGFHTPSQFVLVSFRDLSKDWILPGRCCLSLLKRNEFFTHAELEHLRWSLLTLAEGGSEVRELPSKIIITPVRV